MKSKGQLRVVDDKERGMVEGIAKKAKKAATVMLPFGLDKMDILKDLDLGDLEASLGQMTKKARRFIKKHPTQAVLIGLGVGYLLGANRNDH